MYLSQNFSLGEFTHSDVALARGIVNDPPGSTLARLRRTAAGMEEVRFLLGDHPIRITSGYRCPELNKAVGSKPTSQHMTGSACDFVCPDFSLPEPIVRKIVGSKIQFDQCILECMTRPGGVRQWVHISFADVARKQALIIDDSGVRAWA